MSPVQIIEGVNGGVILDIEFFLNPNRSLDRKCDIKKYFLHFCLFFLAYFSCLFCRIARYTPLEHIKNLLKNNKTNALKSK